MPCGSNACLTRFMSAIVSGVSSRPRYAAFVKPMPCSPLIDPSSATTPLEQLPLRPRARAGARRRSSGGDHDVDVDVAVADVAEARNRQSESRLELVDELEQLRNAALRHDDVVVELERRDRLAATARARAGRARAPARSASSCGAQHFGRAGLAARLLRRASASAGDLLGQPVDLDQQQRAGAGRRERRAAEVVARPPRATRASTSSSAAGTTRARMSRVTASTACATLGNVARSVACTGGFGMSRRMILREDRERAFGADEQVRQVVADDVLHRPCRRCG